MQVRDRDHQTDADHHRATVSSTLKHVVESVAGHLRPKPDLSLVNEKFSDSFERDYTERLLHNRW